MSGLAEKITQIRMNRLDKITSLRFLIKENFPDTIKALRIIDYENTLPKRRKGFNLVKRENKKHGFLYYVRYSHKGKTLPTKFNTHMNNLEEAERFAAENKMRLVEGYLARKDGLMFKMLENFYETKNKKISERCAKEYKQMIIKKFMPFLKKEKITEFDQIKMWTLARYQDFLIDNGMKPQTVNNNMKPVKKILAEIARKGIIKEDPGKQIRCMPVEENDKKVRGCYELERIKGVFNKKWKDKTSYILSAIIYTTGMRNIEIKRMKMEDIVIMQGIWFINIKKSKTPSGKRLIPLHNIVYRKLKAWAVENKRENNVLFDFCNEEPFNKANNDLAKQLKVSDEELERENITFYSGRSFWKTLMNTEGLGDDIEEIWMGHKVTNDVEELYNRKDKIGLERKMEKAKKAISILDRCVFKKP